MTAFWLLSAALAAVVVVLLLRPLLGVKASAPVSRTAANISIYRDQLRELDADLAAGTLARADYDKARAELEARLLEDVPQAQAQAERAEAARPSWPGRKSALVVGAAVPVLAFALYLAVGDPGAMQRAGEHTVSAAQIEAMLDRLAARLRENPEDADGWKLLGRAYSVMGRFKEASDAFSQAALRAPRDAQLLADFADALAMARGHRLEGEPEQLVLRALEIDPTNLKAMALAGTAAYERKDYAAAAAHWERMLPHVPPDSEEARSIRENVAEARKLQTPSVVNALRGMVTLSPELKASAAPDDTVFVFARAADGPPVPLAVARAHVRDLPYRFELDDSMAMTPALKLSAFPRVVVAARVSKSGTATAQPGDLQGTSSPVPNDASTVHVVIDSLVQ
jgi:cytochrome c-type biogenesis protein CcmH